MFSKLKLGLSNSMNVVSLIILSVTLLLGFAGFVRIEIKLNEQETKLAAVERICIERTPKLSPELKGKKVIFGFLWFTCSHCGLCKLADVVLYCSLASLH